ncbi:hypothetical protein [Dactylosporangium sp. NPDC000521]|uniref:hypothetical protein n=1 Tax=Dactylosporangium sp. NPDC000521 TaxID=3363975 RepID=UPI00367AF8EA
MSAGAVLGWIVLYRAEGRWCLDFDGEVHPTRERADEALGLAVDGGHRAVLVEASWVQPPPRTSSAELLDQLADRAQRAVP